MLSRASARLESRGVWECQKKAEILEGVAPLA